MREINQPGSLALPRTQSGVAAIEFSLVALLFFTLVFGVIEVARAFYICNTLQEVTRRAASAAAVSDFSNAATLNQIRREAIFRDSSGALAAAPDITDENVRIEYMSITRSGNVLAMEPTVPLPKNPAQNRLECQNDPNSTKCIRLVRVRICQPGTGSDCAPIPFNTVVSLFTFKFNLPKATTVKVAESLGFIPGMKP